MKGRFTYIVISIVSLALGVATVWFYRSNLLQFQIESEQKSIAETVKQKFRFIYGGEGKYDTNYTFQTPPEEKIFASDCIGCEEEVGNVVIFKESRSLEQTRYLFQSNSENDLIERGEKLDSNGAKLGERGITVFRDENKIVGARVFWTEGNDFWAIQAPSVELAKELETSELFRRIREKKTSEFIRKYCYSE